MQSQAEFLTKGSLFVKGEFGSPPLPLFWAILRSIFFSFSESPYQEPYLCSFTCKQTLEQWKPPSAGYWFWWNKSWLSRMVAFFFFFKTGGVPDLSLVPLSTKMSSILTNLQKTQVRRKIYDGRHWPEDGYLADYREAHLCVIRETLSLDRI